MVGFNRRSARTLKGSRLRRPGELLAMHFARNAGIICWARGSTTRSRRRADRRRGVPLSTFTYGRQSDCHGGRGLMGSAVKRTR